MDGAFQQYVTDILQREGIESQALKFEWYRGLLWLLISGDRMSNHLRMALHEALSISSIYRSDDGWHVAFSHPTARKIDTCYRTLFHAGGFTDNDGRWVEIRVMASNYDMPEYSPMMIFVDGEPEITKFVEGYNIACQQAEGLFTELSKASAKR